jgi:hypothetical protein
MGAGFGGVHSQSGREQGDRVVPMDVSLLYFDGCPNHYDTRELLEALLDEAGWDGTIQLINVDSPERAKELEFRGSPTVLINGDDPFLDTDAPVGESCRIYPIDGGFRGTPPEQALSAAIAHGIGD